MSAIALALTAALAWGVADFVAGREARRVALLSVLVVSQGAGLALALLVVALRLEPPPSAAFLLPAALSGVCGMLGLAALYRGLAVGAMSVVAPLAATGAAIPVAVGVATGERPGLVQAAGLAIALAGVVLVSLEPRADGVTRRVASGAGLGLLAALALGLFFVALDRASEEDVLWAVLVNRITSVSLLVTAVLVSRPELRAARSRAPALALVGIFDIGANALLALASTKGLVSVVGVLGSLYPVVTVVLAAVLLRERLRPAQRAGAAGALAGAALIGAG